MAASKRMPYRSYYYYYCCVSFPFGSVGIVLYNQRRGCVVRTVLTQIIFCRFRSVRAGSIMNGFIIIVVSGLLSTTN